MPDEAQRRVDAARFVCQHRASAVHPHHTLITSSNKFHCFLLRLMVAFMDALASEHTTAESALHLSSYES